MPAKPVKIAIIGAGMSGIAAAIQLKKRFGLESCTIYERGDDVGGTWRANTYPGAACDVPSHMYSLSFELNPDWTQVFSCQAEILDYFRKLAQKYNLYPHIHFHTECLGATWQEVEGVWNLKFRNNLDGTEFSETVNILILAVGLLANPYMPSFEGLERFKGEIFHSAKWKDNIVLSGKKVAVIGSGSSATQIVPAVAPQTEKLVQFMRTPHWMVFSSDGQYSSRTKWLFRNIPGLMRLYRFIIFLLLESGFRQFTKRGTRNRQRHEESLTSYIISNSPPQYHSFLIPRYPLGTKRIVFERGMYFPTLHRDNFELVADPIERFEEKGIVTRDGKHREFDVVVCATGFEAQNFLAPMEILGRDGVEIHRRWEEKGGAEAYMGTTVAGFPNMFVMFGPNTATGHMSVIYSSECQVHYMLELIKPIMEGRIKWLDVRAEAEERFNGMIQEKMKDLVWMSKECKSWYKNENGTVTTLWPEYVYRFWWMTRTVKWKDYETKVRGFGNEGQIKSPRSWPTTLGLAVSATAIACILASRHRVDYTRVSEAITAQLKNVLTT